MARDVALAEMVGQLDLDRPLHQPRRQLREHSAGPEHLLLVRSAREQLLNELVRQIVTHFIRQPLKDPRRGAPNGSLALSRSRTGTD
jgi:hypothetical protein